ncbi:Metallo-beta-lactamase superfamily protein [Marinospirillum celere]|uniref:Metallo-beta-lactamase superfamily protein n=1 Tax=Marinospirillum celere TaxID=1122252 RepID=A0A1I1FII6_9GAMM|nr:MBL fold metallo-hydrolase [Marinospirillum celere]SFB97498.1 Metallo-beta-lactamase superfamily protein [Marinospirillum celere]
MTAAPEENRLLYEDDEHQFVWFGWEEKEGSNSFVQTNQCLVINQDQGYLFDPGGTYVFHQVLEQVTRYLHPRQINTLIATHQDPDVCSSAPYWMKVTDAKLLISRLWLHFVSHFGLDEPERVVPLPDKGAKLRLPSGDHLLLLPAHFLHSEGNFSVFDERSGILFSGDIGASIFPAGKRKLFVEDFDEHQAFMEPFHKRYMHSNAVCRHWVKQIRNLPQPVKMMVPQHGSMFAGDQVENFLSWFEELECGGDQLQAIYSGQPV